MTNVWSPFTGMAGRELQPATSSIANRLREKRDMGSVLMRQHWAKRTATHQVHVNMVHLLPTVTVAVHNQAVAISGNAFLFCNFSRNGHHTPQRKLMFGFNVIGGRDKHIWNDEDMGRCLRGNITKRGDQFVLVNHIRRNFTTNNFTENSFFGHERFLEGENGDGSMSEALN
ncbi:hypothetical protein BBAD15_g2757 [Beauveria bassiana D1-5]|uniref:Uncharacterized protein n=1 Tax=Beauveria bassiana D1-5 TaxID=1245745 RepID=A0A0A2VYQ4_BEABA|nr:hypothetical protein BBAD15_g2757 [Beauveria bassiana D1-5]